MPAPSAPAASVPLGWLILIPLGCLALSQILFLQHDFVPVLEGGLADTDAYTRMIRVLDLHASGDWFDSTLARVNPPQGHLQHWTRPLDAMLLAGALLLEPFFGFRAGLHVWGAAISPLFLALSVVALSWATAPIFDRYARLLACLAFLMQPTIQAYTILGRPDHHSLQILLFVVLVGLTLRLAVARDARLAVAAGAVAALGIWISPEGLLAMAASLAVLGLYWLLGDQRMAHNCRDYLVAATASLALGLAIERGPDMLTVMENDRLSLHHVALLALMAAFWMVMARAARQPGQRHVGAGHGRSNVRHHPVRAAMAAPRRGPVHRVWMMALGAAVTVGVLLVAFPGLADGPLGRVDPLYRELRLERIVEYQPLLLPDWLAAGRYAEIAHRVISVMGIALVALPYLGLMLWRRQRPDHRAWVTLAVALAAFLPIALMQVRFSIYAQAVLAIVYAGLVTSLLGRLAPSRLAPWVRSPLIVGALFWPLLVSAALPAGELETAGRACPTDRIAAAMNQLAAGSRKTVLAHSDYAPELLYRTQHRFLSIPNHRPQPGFAASWRILTAVDDSTARRELEDFGVDWILLCPSGPERQLFGRGDATSLYRRLLDGAAPSWLRTLPLDGDLLGEVRLFEVVRPQAPATDPVVHGEGT